MTIKEAIKARHMVRQYTDKAIPADIVKLFNERIAENNKKYNLNLTLAVGNSDGVGSMAKLLLSRTVNNYIVLAGDGHFSGIDLGIGKYHFEVGAGREKFEWES